MNNNVTFTDKRLLEALDYIDESFIAEVTEDYKVYPTADEYIGDKKPHSKILRSLKYVAAVAACALLMSTLIPVVQYVSGNLSSFLPSGWFETTEEYDPPYWEYTPELEPLSKELVEEIEEAYLLYKLKMPVDEYIAQFPEDEREYQTQGLKDIQLFTKSPYYSIYYGKFGDSVVAAETENILSGAEIKVAGYSFFYSSSPANIYVYNNGTFCDIETAYKIGLLTDDDIKIIAERHDIYRNKLRNGEY